MSTAPTRRRRIVRSEAPPELTEAQQRRALGELAKRKRSQRTIDFRRLCHPKQRKFVEDRSPLVSACCSRRAGKTWGLLAKMLSVALAHPWAMVPYVTLTRAQGKRNLWPTLRKLDHQLQLGGKFNAVELSYTLPNGAVIAIFGSNDETEIERLRGSAYPLVVIDEAQAFRAFLKSFIEEVLEPATLDYQGQIVLAGTPNASCSGLFHDVSKGIEKGWSLHSWTLLENPHLPHAADWIAKMMKRRGWTKQTPRYRREYGAEWVRDEQSQVFHVTEKNIIEEFPEAWARDWEYVCGVDLGFVHVTAFVVMAFSETLGKTVAVESYQIRPSHFGQGTLLLTPHLLAVEIERLRSRYDFLDIMIDPGGLGAKFIEDLRTRFRIPCHAAEKRMKLGSIEVLNGDLQAGKLLIVEGTNKDLIDDARLLEWNLDRVSDKRHGGQTARSDLLISDKTPDHLLDAFLYGHRRCRAYLHDGSANDDGPPKPGTPEYETWLEEERDRKQVAASMEADKPWWAQEPGSDIDSDFGSQEYLC